VNTEASRLFRIQAVSACIAELQAVPKHSDPTLGSVAADLRRVVAALKIASAEVR
jgi:hypothetical protein